MPMKTHPIFSFVRFLYSSLILMMLAAGTSPAHALRPMLDTAGLEEELTFRDGLEEQVVQVLQNAWPGTAEFRGRPPSDLLSKRLIRVADGVGVQLLRLYPGPAQDSRLAKISWNHGGDTVMVLANASHVQLWHGEELGLWTHHPEWEWPWIEQNLEESRLRILLTGANPIERIPLFRHLYQELWQQLRFPDKLSNQDKKALETAAFYIAKNGPSAWISAQKVIATYQAAIPGLDLTKPEERLQFLIATYQGVMELSSIRIGQTQRLLSNLEAPNQLLEQLNFTGMDSHGHSPWYL